MLIVDAGPLYAAAARRDRDHERSVALLRSATRPLIIPHTVVVEVAYLLGDRLGPAAEIAFTRSLEHGELLVEPVLDPDWARVAELMERYADLPLGLVDASVVTLAERLGQTRIASLDHRHLGVVSPRHCPRLELVP